MNTRLIVMTMICMLSFTTKEPSVLLYLWSLGALIVITTILEMKQNQQTETE
jgi:hypothetical protein